MTDNTLTNETLNHRNPADDLLSRTPPARPGVTITYDGQTAPDLRLMELVYDELRALAGAYLLYERPDHTLQATALVHEAFLRISEITGIHWQSRAHFFAFAAEAIRRVLVDSARRHKSVKRGGAAARTDLTPTLAAAGDGVAIDVLDLNAALDDLARKDAPAARVVECRYFGGLTTEEIAEVLGVSPRTVDNHWAYGKAWLHKRLQ